MITILIRCSNDYRVLECIRSIRETSPNSPIVVSMTPNNRLRKAVLETGAGCCIVPRHNAAITNNKGLEFVKTDKVVVTDADTIFEKNTLNLLRRALDKYDVVKPVLVFRSGMKPLYFSLVANLRTFFNDNATKMYIPGVAFSLKIKHRIGGYFFDEKVPWGEDSDFSYRVNENRLRIKVVGRAILYHPSVSVIHDLADAFLIGSKKQNDNAEPKVPLKRFKLYRKLLASYGIPTLIYGTIWYLFFDLGRVLRRAKPIYNRAEIFSWMILSKKKY